MHLKTEDPVFLTIGIYTGSTYLIVLSSALIMLIALLAFLVWKRSSLQEGDSRNEDKLKEDQRLT